MKLSEAVLLGSTAMKAEAGFQCDTAMTSGCALGMAALAGGDAVVIPVQNGHRTGGNYWELKWPWMAGKMVRRPCWCFPFWKQMLVKDAIAHIFDQHVFGRKNWTLDGLVAWIETIEPPVQEPSPVEVRQESTVSHD